MTREEIIEHLDSIVGTYEILLGHGVNSDILDVDDIEAIKEAISALSENKGDLISRQAVLDELEKWEWQDLYLPIHFKQILDDIPPVENKGEWIPFSKELPPKGEKVHVSTFGIVTIGERTSEADETLRLSILEPMNNLYKNIDPKQYQITHWQSLPKGHER